MFKLAHISDLHFSRLTLNPLQFLSKQWLGNLNVFFFRKKHYSTLPLVHLFKMLLEENPIDYLLITGDISSTASEKEFQKAEELFLELEAHHIKTFFLPGNHDAYTKKAYKNRLFYNYFSNPIEHPDLSYGRFTLKHHGVEAHSLQNHWYLILLDTAIATPLISSKGLFSEKIEANLLTLLQEIPSNSQIMIANHFPYSQQEKQRKILVNGDKLLSILKQDKRIKFYLHGHTHKHNISPIQPNVYPITLDSGSLNHLSFGTWNLLTLDNHEALIDIFHFKNQVWQKSQEQKIHIKNL
jgi:3',5'-cyclic AMP phosphodiesterase CpdA